MRFLLALALVGALAGCSTYTITTDPSTYSVKGPTAELRAGERIALLNGHAAQTVIEIGEQAGNHFVVDLRQVTDTAISMASQHLQTIGITVDANARKKVTLKVTHAQTAFRWSASFNSRYRTRVDMSAELDDGTTVTVSADNNAPAVPFVSHEVIVKRAVEGATVFAVTKLLNDGRFAYYVSR